MFGNLSWSFVTILFSLGVGPLAAIGPTVGNLDKNGIYLVISLEPIRPLFQSVSSVRGRELGPRSSRFSTMVMLPPSGHANLKSAGYRMLPASVLAGICGFSVNPKSLPSRS
jgi:hypothetical protein